MNKTTTFRDLGLMDYQQAWDYQEKLFNEIIEMKLQNRQAEGTAEPLPTPNHLLFVEHPHVYTLGKNGSENNLLINTLQLQNHEATFVKTNRGGDITYHGPGQIVGYPILDLDNFFPDIHKYVAYLEEAVIKTIATYGLKGERLKGASGVWLDADQPGKARKICAIGIRTSRWVTMHGFAFNINADLRYFDYINPCGFTDKKATSLQKELGRVIALDEVKEKLKNQLADIFAMQLVEE